MKPAIFTFLSLFLLPVALSVPIIYHHPVKPSPGNSGIWYDKDEKIVHTYYGSNDVPGHMEHLKANVATYPHNALPFSVGQAGSTKNRKKATAKSGLPIRPGFHRDEKPPNFVDHDGNSVTVEHLPAAESREHLYY